MCSSSVKISDLTNGQLVYQGFLLIWQVWTFSFVESCFSIQTLSSSLEDGVDILGKSTIRFQISKCDKQVLASGESVLII